MVISSGLNAILIKVAAPGLSSSHLGQPLSELCPYLLSLESTHGINSCGEGGEYESFTLDCALFTSRIVIDSTVVSSQGVEQTRNGKENVTGVVSYLDISSHHLEEKSPEEIQAERDRYLRPLHLLSPSTLQAVSVCLEKPIQGNVLTFEHIAPWAQEGYTCERNVMASIEKTETPLEKTILPRETSSSACFAYRPALRATLPLASSDSSSSDTLETVAFDLISTLKQSPGECAHVNFFVPDMRDFARVNVGYSKNFAIRPPSRACTEAPSIGAWCLSSALPTSVSEDGANALSFLSVDAQIVFPSPTYPREVLHIQGLSHWAPANIGPYAQAVGYRGIYSYAGQIGMLPHDLSLPPQPSVQLRQIMRNVHAVLSATGTELKTSILGGNMFIAADALGMNKFEQSVKELEEQFLVPSSSTALFAFPNARSSAAVRLSTALRYAMNHYAGMTPVVDIVDITGPTTHTDVTPGTVSTKSAVDEDAYSGIGFDKNGRMKVFGGEDNDGGENSDDSTLDIPHYDVNNLEVSRDERFEEAIETSSSLSIDTTPLALISCAEKITPYAPLLFPVAPHLPKFCFYELQTTAVETRQLEDLDMKAFTRLSPVMVNGVPIAVVAISGILSSEAVFSLGFSALVPSHASAISGENLAAIAQVCADEVSFVSKKAQVDSASASSDLLWSKIIYAESPVSTTKSLQRAFASVSGENLGYLASTTFVPSSSMIFALGEGLNVAQLASNMATCSFSSRAEALEKKAGWTSDAQKAAGLRAKVEILRGTLESTKSTIAVVEQWMSENNDGVVCLLQGAVAAVNPQGRPKVFNSDEE